MSQDELYPIKGFENRYAVTRSGKVWIYPKRNSNRYPTGRWMRPSVAVRAEGSPSKGGTGYHVVQLFKEGVRKSITVHRLVATTFIDNPQNLPQINHLDFDKSNNAVSNLEWCTAKQNMAHRYGRR
jgi:hypothetical protein